MPVKKKKAGFKIDLRKIMRECAEHIIEVMRGAIWTKRDVEGLPVLKNKDSTIAKKGFDRRMYETGDFALKAYTRKATKRSARITIKKTKHPNSNATYFDIAAWNQRGGPRQSEHILRASNHFGIGKKTEVEVLKKINDEAHKQLEKTLNYSATIEVIL